MIKITAEHGDLVHCRSVKITDSDGNALKGIRAIDIRLRPDEVVTATCEIFCENIDLTAKAQFLMADPITGLHKAVRSVVFKDGSIWSPEVRVEQEGVKDDTGVSCFGGVV